MFPAQGVQLGHVCQLAHGAVRLGGVEDQFPGKANHFLGHFSQLLD